jgi:hypothetical protein
MSLAILFGPYKNNDPAPSPYLSTEQLTEADEVHEGNAQSAVVAMELYVLFHYHGDQISSAQSFSAPTTVYLSSKLAPMQKSP